MKATRPTRRAAWLLAVLLQLLLPSVGVLADARLEAASRATVTHVESRAFQCGSRWHSPECAICQFLRTHPDEGGATVRLPVPAEQRIELASRGEVGPPPRPVSPALPRGPPQRS